MTLRVTLEIVPYGDESAKYSIGYLDISNMGGSLGLYEYKATHFSEEDNVLEQTTLAHTRQDGPWVLVKKAIESLNI